jgi:Glycosyltransferases involved in cell wall biogenesis
MLDLSVIVPTFNDRTRAEATAEMLHGTIAEAGLHAEIVLVDDGSDAAHRPDSSSLPDGVRVVQLDRNRGKGFAVRTGLAETRGSTRIFTDVDLPYGTRSIVDCYEKLSTSGADFVYGDRSHAESTTVSRLRKRRRISSLVFRSAVFSIVGIRQADTQCGIKGMRDWVAKAMVPRLSVDGFAFDVELFRFATDSDLRIVPIPVRLANNEVSTVRLVRDSAAMVRDLVAIRARSVTGHYRLQRTVPQAERAS